MRATPFLSFPVDPEGPWAGLGQRARSVEIMPAHDGGGGLQVFHLMASGVAEEDVAALEASLEERLHSIATVHYDRVTRRWQAEAVMDDGGLRASCLGVPLAMEGFEVPWIHIDAHEASVRLLPKADPDLFMLHARLEKALGRGVSVSYLDFAEYQQWLRRLHAAA